jgi:hypothetical protein
MRLLILQHTSRQQHKSLEHGGELVPEVGSRGGSWKSWPTSNTVHPEAGVDGSDVAEWSHHHEAHMHGQQPPKWGHNTVHPVVVGKPIDGDAATFETPEAAVEERAERDRLDRSLAPPTSLSGRVWGQLNAVHPDEGSEDTDTVVPRLDLSSVGRQW